jgi:hypothetical protein
MSRSAGDAIRRVAFPLGLIIVVAVVVAGAAPVRRDDEYQLSVRAGLQTQLSDTDVAQIARNALEQMAAIVPGRSVQSNIISIDANFGRDLQEPEVAAAAPESDDRIMWIVWAEGPFATERGRRPEPLTSDSGYFLIDDATGTIVGMGWN